MTVVEQLSDAILRGGGTYESVARELGKRFGESYFNWLRRTVVYRLYRRSALLHDSAVHLVGEEVMLLRSYLRPDGDPHDFLPTKRHAWAAQSRHPPLLPKPHDGMGAREIRQRIADWIKGPKI